MKPLASLALTLVLGPALVTASAAQQRETAGARSASAGSRAEVHFKNAQGEPAGEATLRETPNGVLMTVNLRGLPPGEHGFHFHEKGACQPPFESAGGHFNPTRAGHGFEHAKGPHAGDLPNLIVPDGGTVKVELLADRVTLAAGNPNSLFDADGTALVVHAGPDDYRTDPAGDSGARIACGVVERARDAR